MSCDNKVYIIVWHVILQSVHADVIEIGKCVVGLDETVENSQIRAINTRIYHLLGLDVEV
jgi:hypothetical protein